MSKEIITTGEHTIDNIIRSEFGDLSLDEIATKKEEIARLNPHIVSLESLTVGDVLNLDQDQPPSEEDQPPSEEDQPPSEEDQPPSEEDQPPSEEDQFIDGDLTVHTPAVKKKK